MSDEQLMLFGRVERLKWDDAFPIFHELEGKFKGKNYHYQYKPLLAEFSGRWIDLTTPFDIETYRENRKLDGLKPSAINREQSVITRLFNAFYEWKKLKQVGAYNFENLALPESNPGEEVKRADERPFVRTTALTPMEFATFCDYAHPRVRRICVLAVLTMLRRKDIQFLSKSNFNAVLKQLQGQQSKTKLPYNIPVSQTVSLILGDSRYDYVVDFTNFRRYFDRARKESGVNFWFMDLRRTGATNLLLEGTDLVTIQKLLGHADIKMTQRYLQPNPLHMREAVNKLDENFGNVLISVWKK